MELIQAIALLCQVNIGGAVAFSGLNNELDKTFTLVNTRQLQCQQSYLNCVLKRNNMNQTEALQKCILEK